LQEKGPPPHADGTLDGALDAETNLFRSTGAQRAMVNAPVQQENHSTDSIKALLAPLRSTIESGVNRDIAWRKEQLSRLRTLVTEGEEALSAALSEDLGKPAVEGWMTDLVLVTSEIDYATRHLESWIRPKRVFVPMSQRPAGASIEREPLGVVLVVSPWNYPINLALAPAVAAFAAGNCVVIKPSELAPASSRALVELARQHLDPTAIVIVEGGRRVVAAMISAGVDHVFFTGSAAAAREVLMDAAEHLTPVTLELGGKNPAIVLADADLKVAARRIAWGRFLNAGQTCVAPDYALVERIVADRFVAEVRSAIAEFYGSDARSSADYGRIVDDRHFDRIVGLLTDHGGEIAAGGDFDRPTRYIEPTIVRKPDPSSALMREEIFGPVLVVDEIDGIDDALERIRLHPDPLALYVFTEDRQHAREVARRTRSGGVCINGTVLQLAVPGLPFGGVGRSGTGAYHGRAGFERLSQARAILSRSTWPDLPFLYPPYRPWKEKVVRISQRWKKRAT